MLYMSYRIPQCTKAKVASPTTFTAANVRVTVLPQSKMNSLIIRPRVPMMSKIKALNLATSLIDIHLISYYFNGAYYYEGILSTKTERNLI